MRAVGPLAHTTACHPSLLAVSLEGRGTELGLDPALQVAIRYAQPAPQPREAQPREAQPREAQPGEAQPGEPHPAAARPAGSFGEALSGGAMRPAAPRSRWLDAAVGGGLLAGFELTVRATRPVACQWAAFGPPDGGSGQPAPWQAAPDGHAGPDLARLGQQIQAQSRESRTAVDTRLAVLAACLSAAGWRPETPLMLDDACEGGWIQVRAGQVTVGCVLADLSGVPRPVAIALATWPAPDRAALQPPARGAGSHHPPVAANGSRH
jgi:hypothetical protein